MTEPDRAHPAVWSVTGPDAAQLARLHREQLVMFTPVPADDTAAGSGADVAYPPGTELSVDDLPGDVRDLLARYEAEHPRARLTPVRFVATGGAEGTTAAGAAELPDDDQFVSLVLTETVVDVERATVRSRMLVARRTPDGE